MDGIKIEVTGNIARVTEKPKRITSGTVGLPVDFTFDEQWDGLEKTAVFQAGQVCKIVSGLGASTTVPWEVLQNAHEWLSIGVYGENGDGSVAIPTIWANVKVIDVGTSPNGDSCKAPSKAEWTRMLIGQSAYELAVALGFSGSEEKWIESLNGNPVELRCVDDMIQWRLQTEPEQEWQDLTNVAEFQQMAAEAAARAEAAAAKLEGNLVLAKGEGLNSIVQALELDEEDVQKGKAPQANAEGSTVFGEYGIVHDRVGENCEGSDTVSFSEDGTKIFFVNSLGEKKEFNVGETSFLVNYWNKIFGARCFAANNNNKLIGVHLAAFGNGNYLGYLYDPDNGWIEYPTTIPSAAAIFGTNNYVLADNAVSFGRFCRNFGINSITGGYDSRTGGRNILKIVADGSDYSTISQRGISVIGGETYTLSLDYKLSLTALDMNSFIARFIFRDKNKVNIGQFDVAAERATTKDWTRLVKEVTAPDGAVTLELTFWFWKNNIGEYWIDNISLRKTGAAREIFVNNHFDKGFDKWTIGYSPSSFSLEPVQDSGMNGFAWGDGAKVLHKNQAALCKYNAPHSDALFTIGNGTSDDDRRNAFEVRDNSVVVNGQEMTRENIASLLAHLLNKKNPHGVTVAQLGIPELHARYLTIDAGKSVRFRIEGSSLVFGRVHGAGSSCAAYVVGGYASHFNRAPLITQLAAGTQIALSTVCENPDASTDDQRWYVELSNTNAGDVSIGVYIMGQGVPTFI